MKRISTQKKKEKSALEENCMGFTVYLLLILQPFNQPFKNTVSLFLLYYFYFCFILFILFYFSWRLRIYKGRVSERLRPDFWKKKRCQFTLSPTQPSPVPGKVLELLKNNFHNIFKT